MKIPVLFSVGDSISVGYSPYLRKMTNGMFMFYDRKDGAEEAMKDLDMPLGSNVGDSSNALNYLRTMLSESKWRPDYMTLNCGLHDIKVHNGALQTPLNKYKENLYEILKLLSGENIHLTWIRTTPVDDRQHNDNQTKFKRHAADLDMYNDAADEIMSGAGIEMIDLYSFIKRLGTVKEIYRDHVHYYPEIEALQAAYITGFLQRTLDSNKNKAIRI